MSRRGVPSLPVGQHQGHWSTHPDRGCADVDPEMFFPAPVGAIAPFPSPAIAAASALAKSFCDGCPVKSECRDFALTNRGVYGVWGGTDEWDRRAIHRRAGQRAADGMLV